jgi:hypothetical protein
MVKQTFKEQAAAAALQRKSWGYSRKTVYVLRRACLSDAQIGERAAERKARDTIPTPAAAGNVVELESYSRAQARKETAIAHLRELELSTRRGQLADTAVLRKWLADTVAWLQNRGLMIVEHARQFYGLEYAEWVDKEVRDAFRDTDRFAQDRARELGLPPEPRPQHPVPRPPVIGVGAPPTIGPKMRKIRHPRGDAK